MSSFSTITKQPHQILMPYSSNCFHLDLKLLLSLSPTSKTQTIKLTNFNNQTKKPTTYFKSKLKALTINKFGKKRQTQYEICTNNDLKHIHYLLLSKFLTATLVLSSKRPR